MKLLQKSVMPIVEVQLQLSALQTQAYYQGLAKYVIASAVDGQRVKIPLGILRPFVTKTGISGKFLIKYNDSGKLINITLLA